MHLIEDNHPAEYELGLLEEQRYQYEVPSFLFSTCNQNIIDHMRAEEVDKIESDKTTIKLKKYHPNFNKFSPMGDNYENWGFGNLIQPYRVENSCDTWSFWKLDLPDYATYGKKRINMFCNMISANLKFLISSTYAEPVKIDKRNQLFKIMSLSVSPGEHHNSYGIQIMISPVLADWLDNCSQSDKSAVQHVIYNAYKFIFGAKDSHGVTEDDFLFDCSKGRLVINVYEDGGIWLEGDRNDWELPGYLAGTHNCQSSQFQLLFLVALAKINDLARIQGL